MSVSTAAITQKDAATRDFKSVNNYIVDLTFAESLADQAAAAGLVRALTSRTRHSLPNQSESPQAQSPYFSRGFHPHKLEQARVVRSAAPCLSLLKTTRPTTAHRPVRIVQTALGTGQARHRQAQAAGGDSEFKQKWLETDVGGEGDVKIVEDRNEWTSGAAGRCNVH